jgi:hypothetical protein
MKNNYPSRVDDAPEQPPMQSVGSGSSGSTVWLKMDFRASLTNMLITLPVVVVTVAATWNIAEVQFLAGLMAGVWLASAHNVLWGWLTRNASSSNTEGSERPAPGAR